LTSEVWWLYSVVEVPRFRHVKKEGECTVKFSARIIILPRFFEKSLNDYRPGFRFKRRGNRVGGGTD